MLSPAFRCWFSADAADIADTYAAILILRYATRLRYAAVSLFTLFVLLPLMPLRVDVILLPDMLLCRYICYAAVVIFHYAYIIAEAQLLMPPAAARYYPFMLIPHYCHVMPLLPAAAMSFFRRRIPALRYIRCY